MKKLLFFALLLLPLLASAQLDNKSPQYRVWGPTAINTQGYSSWDTLHFALKVGDITLPKGMLLPVADTALIPPLFYAFIVNQTDSLLYKGNGIQWVKVGGGGEAHNLQQVTEVGNTTTLNVNAKGFYADSIFTAEDSTSSAVVKGYFDQFANSFITMIPGVLGTARLNLNCFNNFGSELDMYGPNSE